MTHVTLARSPSSRPAPIELTERSYQMIAEEAGWFRTTDAGGLECFESEHGYSYVKTWGQLCRQQRLIGGAA